jgi:hypothetical protein
MHNNIRQPYTEYKARDPVEPFHDLDAKDDDIEDARDVSGLI